jgi:HSP20 family protein
VTGERKQETYKKDVKEGRRFSERRYGKFKRSFELPPNADLSQVSADFKDGVLSVLIPKSAAAKPRQITIGSAKSVESGNTAA